MKPALPMYGSRFRFISFSFLTAAALLVIFQGFFFFFCLSSPYVIFFFLKLLLGFYLDEVTVHSESGKQTLGVLFMGHSGLQSGVGLSSRAIRDALIKTGASVTAITDIWKVNQAAATSKADVVILHVNLDELMYAFGTIKALHRKNYVIAYVYWELQTLSKEWMKVFTIVDEVWVASEFVQRAIAKVSSIPINVVRPSVKEEVSLPKDNHNSMSRQQVLRRVGIRVEEKPFIFYFVFNAASVSGRKNPVAFAKACLEAFPADNVICLIRGHSIGKREDPQIKQMRKLASESHNIVFIEDSLERKMVLALYKNIDVYVSPHCAEGLGLTILEAMLRGKAVVATKFGGIVEEMPESIFFGVDYHHVKIGPHNEPYPSEAMWDCPDRASLKAQLLKAYEDNDERVKVQRNAKEWVLTQFSPQSCASQIRKILFESGRRQRKENVCTNLSKHFSAERFRSKEAEAFSFLESDFGDDDKDHPFKSVKVSHALPLQCVSKVGEKAEAPREIPNKDVLKSENGGKCVVYGIGVADSIEFESYMSRIGCEVFAFDCTSNQKLMKPLAEKNRVKLFPYCVGSPTNFASNFYTKDVKNLKLEFHPLSKVMKDLKHDYITFLKFDIEGCEWALFEEEFFKLKFAQLPKFLLFELHTEGTTPLAVPKHLVSGKGPVQVRKLFLKLFNLGYRVVSQVQNTFDSHCMDFLLIKK
jgi:glycosyltransferase involved in cell wall biosynthesis